MTTGARWALRAATSAEHERLDAAFARLDLGRSDAYRAFLRAHLRALPALEAAVETAGASWSGWSPRTALLREDLGHLNDPSPTAPLSVVSELSPGAAWGVQYVLEGSRLGARFLSTRLFADAPRRYLTAQAGAGGWPGFQAELDAGLDVLGDVGRHDAEAGARLAFSRFQDAAQAVDDA